jgi:exosortase
VVCGILVALGGWIWFIRLLFPYALLYSLIPMTDDFIEKLAIPLQSATSVLSWSIGNAIGLDLVRNGHMLTLTLADGSLQYFEVAKACSGLHSLIALMYMGAAIAYLTKAPMWKRWAIFFVGIPIAIAANVLRVTGILAVAGWGSLEFAVSHFHDSASPTLFFVSTLAVLGFRNWMIREKPEPAVAPALLAPALATAADDDDF